MLLELVNFKFARLARSPFVLTEHISSIYLFVYLFILFWGRRSVFKYFFFFFIFLFFYFYFLFLPLCVWLSNASKWHFQDYSRVAFVGNTSIN